MGLYGVVVLNRNLPTSKIVPVTMSCVVFSVSNILYPVVIDEDGGTIIIPVLVV